MLHDINDIMFKPDEMRPESSDDEEDTYQGDDADKGWMVKIMHSWSYTVPHFDQTREMIGSAPGAEKTRLNAT